MGMGTFRQTIEEYKDNCVKLEKRIAELDHLIAAFGAGAQGGSYARRRAVLYIELWDMLKSVRNMEEYVQPVSVQGPGAPKAICVTTHSPARKKK
ncbi:MAG: hypothetical protein LBV27_01450 [Oscillospiraceae bacterium]|jgi:hypothetical protein|nr:hypothetical protein [Oscillospiraceae bacterium]